jgi:predicted O-linked N-acetylglucosamine transferase (SPINDLY family)
MAQVFELHDRHRFQITAYSYGPDDGSELRKRLQRAFDHFVDIREISDLDAARQIYMDRIDILVDLTGFTDKTRSGILALRPAPRQLSYLGYIGTMGADFVDYLIADHFLVPPQHRRHYTEKMLYLPNCFQSNDRKRPRPPAPTRSYCGLPANAFVFCCFNQTYKITPEVFDIWCRLLIAVPNSVLWLFANIPDSVANLRLEARKRGVDPIRLVMAPEVKPDAYLARMRCADLYLDTTPYNAGTTCSDALWMGLPVITCVGDSLSSRMAGSLLLAIGAQELITYTMADYYRLAFELATHDAKLDAIRNKICANRDTAPLFDSARFTLDLENAYIAIMSNSKTALSHAVTD